MVVPRYPLARPPAGTDAHSLPVENVSQAILFSHLRTAQLSEPHGALIPVQLIPDFRDGGWRVRWELATIGSVPASLRDVFPTIDRVHQAHYEPQAWARVCINRERGLLDVTLELPAPELAIPVNSLADATRILSQGARLPATLSGANRQMLGRVEGSHVIVDEDIIGHLEYAPLEEGPLGVRVFVIDGKSFIDIGLGEPLPAPALPEPEPLPEPQTGAWAVTMNAEDLAEPNPRGPRTITFRAGATEE
ncbi:MAG: hypothetical protein Q4G50_01430 [Corynebacterium sp.]|uniref:hypothetical protein n=1 Tax=Corynebacterium sp. TaxID=1720 RepID=UPI0026E07541|nr:hypothetical protein [Corynebacterium sp.]MDO5668641.1 hypothetical protein [Corynebacterium sp.]